VEYAVLCYDVPLTQRSLYNKLRKRIRKIGLPMTSSVYLIPLGARQTVQTILDELESEKAKAERALSQMIRRTKEQVIKKLETSEKEQTEAVKKYDELITKKQKNEKSIDTPMAELLKYKELAQSLYEVAVKQGLKKAENALKEARNLAVVFNMTNNMEAAFLALDGFVKQKWELVGVKSNTAARRRSNEEVAG
jgi:hypothetical protein